MGGPGILSAILDTTGKRVDERIAQSNKMDEEQRDLQTKALLQSIYATDEQGHPKLSDREAEEAWSRIEKLHGHNKGVKDILAKAQDITAKIFHKGRNTNPAMAGRVQEQTSQALSGGAGGPLVPGPQASAAAATPDAAAAPDASTPGPDSDQAAAETYTGLTPPPQKTASMPGGPTATPVGAAPATPVAEPPPPPQRTSTVALMRAGAPPNPIKTTIDAEGRANVEWTRRQMILHRDKLEELDQTAEAKGDKKIAQYVGDDGKLHLIYRSADGKTTYEQDSEGKVRPFVSRLSPGSHLSATDAQSLAKTLGQEFLDEKGQPLDVTKLEIGQELIPVTGGMPNRYKVATQNQVTKTINNLVVAIPALEQSNIQAQTVLGQAQVGTEGTQETAMIDAAGNTNLVQTRSSSTPAGFPVPPRPEAVTSRPVEGMMPAAERDKQLQIARPVRAAGVQIFGDPEHPEIESLETFADLADDPKARARIGTAARLIIENAAAADRTGGVGADVLGSSLSVQGGSLWGALKNWSGITQAVSKQQAAATDAAVAALNPTEQRYLNQVMAAYGTVVGLRKLTSGGAYKFSTDAMLRELPVFGISDVTSKAGYYNKLGRLANEVVEGTKGISTTVLPEQTQYRAAAARLNQLGQGRPAAGGPTPPPARTAPAAAAASGPTRYKTGDGTIYNIPPQLKDSFLRDHPDAKEQ